MAKVSVKEVIVGNLADGIQIAVIERVAEFQAVADRLEKLKPPKNDVRSRIVMEENAEQQKCYDEPFKMAAVDFYQKSGKTVGQVATQLGLSSVELDVWTRKYSPPAVPTTGRENEANLERLKEENEALRRELLNLRLEWDILKNTLGILSTTVCSRGTFA